MSKAQNMMVRDISLLENIPILGSEEFVKGIKQDKVTSNFQDVPEYSNLLKKFLPSIDNVVQSATQYFGISCVEILNNPLMKKTLARKFAILLSHRLTGESQRVIGKKFGNLTYSSVSKISKSLETSMKQDPDLLKQFKDLNKILSNFKT